MNIYFDYGMFGSALYLSSGKGDGQETLCDVISRQISNRWDKPGNNWRGRSRTGNSGGLCSSRIDGRKYVREYVSTVLWE